MSALDAVETDEGTEPQLGLLQRPLWILSGQLGVVIAVVIGFGARGWFRPKLFVLMLLCCAVGLVALGPVRNLGRVVVAAPVVAIVAWWMASYLWTFNVYWWWSESQVALPLIATCVVLVGLLPTRDFRAALVIACYVAMIYTVLQIVVNPSSATVNLDGVPGWRGGFIHKNTMGPFMVFAVLVLASFDPPSWRRRLGMFTGLALIGLSQSTTSLGAGLAVLWVYLFLGRLAKSTVEARATIVIGALLTFLIGAITFSTVVPALLDLRDKDPTLSRRTEVWDGVWNVIEKRPWQGYGIGGVWANPAVDPARSIMSGLGFTVFHSHNGFLEVMLLLGVIGLVLIVWLQLSTIRLALANLRHDSQVAVFAVAYVFLIAILSISEVVLFGIWLAMLSALNSALRRIDAERRARLTSLDDHRHDRADHTVMVNRSVPARRSS